MKNDYRSEFSPHGRYEINKLTSLPMCGFIAQFVEHCTGISRRSRVRSPDFFRLLLSNCLNWKIDCDDHSSPWSKHIKRIEETRLLVGNQFEICSEEKVIQETIVHLQ